ncbi:MAG: hypothetical protein CME62_12505 [Halobacteriovoraceae bacterium]|nr:hypothetical protein [Halobacteriovoraceae bacterium]|tara:strand:- start:12716 stop:12886 length:171 start_codon:yes stop_codon:yes gene_type:complete
MKSLVLSKFSQIWMPSLVLLMFFTIFSVMVFYIFNKKRDERYQHISELPLDEGEKK